MSTCEGNPPAGGVAATIWVKRLSANTPVAATCELCGGTSNVNAVAGYAADLPSVLICGKCWLQPCEKIAAAVRARRAESKQPAPRFKVGDRVELPGHHSYQSYQGVVLEAHEHCVVVRRDDGRWNSEREQRHHPAWYCISSLPELRHLAPPAPEKTPGIGLRLDAFTGGLFERIEQYACELLGEQVGCGGQSGPEALQGCRDMIHAEILRVGAVALVLDRHIQRLSLLGPMTGSGKL